MEKGRSFEEKLKRVEEIIARIQRKEVGLDEMLKDFEEGTQLLRECKEELVRAENRIKFLIEKEGKIEE
ncbi:MAG: exodeoxyribonuclease VII small subunit, partial [Thermoplasmata archaeon]